MKTIAMVDKLSVCKRFQVTVDLVDSSVNANWMSPIIYACSSEEARKHTQWLYNVMHPELLLSVVSVDIKEIVNNPQANEAKKPQVFIKYVYIDIKHLTVIKIFIIG